MIQGSIECLGLPELWASILDDAKQQAKHLLVKIARRCILNDARQVRALRSTGLCHDAGNGGAGKHVKWVLVRKED